MFFQDIPFDLWLVGFAFAIGLEIWLVTVAIDALLGLIVSLCKKAIGR